MTETDMAAIMKRLTPAQRERIVGARWHEWSRTWRVICGGRTEEVLRQHGLIDGRVFPVLTPSGLAAKRLIEESQP